MAVTFMTKTVFVLPFANVRPPAPTFTVPLKLTGFGPLPCREDGGIVIQFACVLAVQEQPGCVFTVTDADETPPGSAFRELLERA